MTETHTTDTEAEQGAEVVQNVENGENGKVVVIGDPENEDAWMHCPLEEADTLAARL